MGNPQIPNRASFPVPPPAGNLQLVDPRTGLPTPYGWEFLQKLWASIQGSGGLIDLTLISPPIVGMILSLIEGRLAQLSPTPILPVWGASEGPFGPTPLLAPMAVRAGSAAMADTAAAISAASAAPLTIGGVEVGVIVDHGLDLAGAVTTAAQTVATLPAGVAAGARSFVTDATMDLITGLGLAVVGGGGNAVPVYYDGAAWMIG